ncbi:MAG: helix-turn-helix transcriptional regulator [Gemmatimonadota bacterium]
MKRSKNAEPGGPLGEFEQLVLLATLQQRDGARAREIRARIEASAGRSVSRGALYATLDRLVEKDLLNWELEESTPARGGLASRRFLVTERGLQALRRSVGAVMTLSRGLERLLGEA